MGSIPIESIKATPAPERPVVQCSKCELNQFVTSNGLCRRCRAALALPPVELLEVEAVEQKWTIIDFGATLFFWREFLGFTQSSLARAMGDHSHSFICRLESPRHRKINPSLGYVERAADAMGIKTALLLRHPTKEDVQDVFVGAILGCMSSASEEKGKEAIRRYVMHLVGNKRSVA